jgi:hypothetical protein
MEGAVLSRASESEFINEPVGLIAVLRDISVEELTRRVGFEPELMDVAPGLYLMWAYCCRFEDGKVFSLFKSSHESIKTVDVYSHRLASIDSIVRVLELTSSDVIWRPEAPADSRFQYAVMRVRPGEDDHFSGAFLSESEALEEIDLYKKSSSSSATTQWYVKKIL